MSTALNATRYFLPKQIEITSWDQLQPFFEDLQQREIGRASDLEQWLKDKSELDAMLEEEMGWRYIRMNIDTTNATYQEAFSFFVNEINPKVAPYQHNLNLKLIESTYLEDLDKEKYKILIRSLRKQIDLYREENIPLLTQLEQDSQEFSAIAGKLKVTYEGKDYTLQQAAKFLRSTDRNVREAVYKLISGVRLSKKHDLDKLYSRLMELRQKVAVNADYDNFRDYKFDALGRFDYTPQDCYEFHQSIAKQVIPVINEFDQKRKKSLNLAELKPWDMVVDISGKNPLHPFDSGKDLSSKAVKCLGKINPFFGDCLQTMKEMGHLDLESKAGKAPGGFNYPLYESGVPFIFMNAVGTFRDMITMLHEGGHAIHSFLSKDLELVDFKSLPSEVAELASMSMELISMDHWDVFLQEEEELIRAKREQLQGVLQTLPWVAAIDKFQHWVYTNPGHSADERKTEWLSIMSQLGSSQINYEGQEEALAHNWQKQLHLYEVPFYYIEYGMAQLGAIAIWRNYRENPEKAIEQYIAALKLGYTKSIGEIYETAGIAFDFSESYVKELVEFVKSEITKLD